jgi:aspartate aminotransferase-like enzyme
MTTLPMTPGPTRVPERVFAAGAMPMLHIGHMGDIRPADVRPTLDARAEIVAAGQQ